MGFAEWWGHGWDGDYDGYGRSNKIVKKDWTCDYCGSLEPGWHTYCGKCGVDQGKGKQTIEALTEMRR